ncbi:hypothetical protein LCGC14_2711060 [marine sediment metagenome]|uniref:Uncharacterized protein n=1 Tax=marine sediment metagenome TaxID=412755 RepID=A0A0F8ZCV2_9ZZZZ
MKGERRERQKIAIASHCECWDVSQELCCRRDFCHCLVRARTSLENTEPIVEKSEVPNPTGTQQRILKNLAADRNWNEDMRGPHKAGGASNAVAACWRRGWVNSDWQITRAGIEAISPKATTPET